MKPLFFTKTLVALAVAVAAAAAAVSQAQEQPIPPPAADNAVPANIQPGTPLADVVKMVQAGVEASTIQSYVANSQSAFNLDADKIIFLKDMGVPSDLINAMMDRDKTLYASNVAPPPAPAPVTTVATSTPDTAPPTTEVTVNYFYNSLSPYGTWVDVDGYGRCWRPTVVVYDTSWRPYCDRGHWVYTDCGWYWDSDYSWGIAFHYGRWFHHARFGWCWYPDTVWAPSWVAWRSGGDYCGWAPLPPRSEFRPGLGFYYRGASVGFDFDFGLNVDSFLFVSSGHFCDRHPRSFCVDRARVPDVFHHTTFINNYVVHDRVIENRGIDVDRIRNVTHRNIEPVHVGALPNAGRQGWRGGNGHSFDRSGADNHGDRNQVNHDAGNRDFNHHDATPNRGGLSGNNGAHDHDNNTHNAADAVRVNHGPEMGNIVVTGGDSDRRRQPGAGASVGNHSGPSVSAQNTSPTVPDHPRNFDSARGTTISGNHNDTSHSAPVPNTSSVVGHSDNFPTVRNTTTDGQSFNRQQWHRDASTAGNLQGQASTPVGSVANSTASSSGPVLSHNRPSGGDRSMPQNVTRGTGFNSTSGMTSQSATAPVRTGNAFNADRNAFGGDRGNSQANSRQNFNVGAPASATQQHGAEQLQQHPVVVQQHTVVPQSPPHPVFAEAAPRTIGTPPTAPSPGQNGAHNSGGSSPQNNNSNPGNGGGNNGSNHNSDNRHQNH